MITFVVGGGGGYAHCWWKRNFVLYLYTIGENELLYMYTTGDKEIMCM